MGSDIIASLFKNHLIKFRQIPLLPGKQILSGKKSAFNSINALQWQRAFDPKINS